MSCQKEVMLKKIYKQSFDSLYSLAFYYLKSENMCKDVIQDAFFILLKTKVKFIDEDDFRKFLYICIRNQCLNIKRHEKVKINNNNELLQLLKNDELNKNIKIEETHDQVHQAIQKLPPRSKQIILKSMYGYNNKEIAKTLNISINTVKTLKKRAYEALREQLSNFK